MMWLEASGFIMAINKNNTVFEIRGPRDRWNLSLSSPSFLIWRCDERISTSIGRKLFSIESPYGAH